jgi:flagellar motor switch/type III secretory pathway protein FliN
MPMPSQRGESDPPFLMMQSAEIVKVQNRLYDMLEFWKYLMEQHFGLSCRWNGVMIDQSEFSESDGSQPQLIYLIKSEQLIFSWSFDDRFVRHLLGFAFGLSAEESIQLIYSEMEQLFFKQVYVDTMTPVLNDSGIDCSEPQIQNGRREVNPLIGDQDAYYQFHFEMKVPALKENVTTTLSFTQKMLDKLLSLPPVKRLTKPKVSLSDDALRQIFSPVEAWLGTVDLSLGELKELQPGDVLVVSKGINDLVELKIAGELMFKGALGVVERRLSVQLQDIIHSKNHKIDDDSSNITDNKDHWFGPVQTEQAEREIVSILDDPSDQSEFEFDWEKL